MLQAWRYRKGTLQAESVELATIARRRPAGSMLWIDGEDLTPAELTELEQLLGLDQLILAQLREPNERTKLERVGDQCHVALHDCRYVDGQLAADEIDVAFAPGWLLTVRRAAATRPHHGSAPRDSGFPLDAVRRRFEANCQGAGPDVGFLLWAICDVIIDRYFDVTDRFDDRLDEVEEIVLRDPDDSNDVPRNERRRRSRSQPRELFALSKSLLQFRRAALPLREVVGAVLRRETPAVGDAVLPSFQDLYDHVLRVGDLVETQRDIVTGLRDAELAVNANQMSLVQQRIAAWGAILIVATLITGVLGMNFRNAPELDWEEGFGVVAGVMLFTGLPLFLYFKRKRWL